MPNGVQNWPDQFDPRSDHGGPLFYWKGFKNEYPAPWRWWVHVQDAVGVAAIFNGDHLVSYESGPGVFGEALYVLELVATSKVKVWVYPQDPPQPDGTTIVVEVGFERSDIVPPLADGFGVSYEYPLPALTVGSGTPGGDVLLWPTPVTFEPRGWDTPV